MNNYRLIDFEADVREEFSTEAEAMAEAFRLLRDPEFTTLNPDIVFEIQHRGAGNDWYRIDTVSAEDLPNSARSEQKDVKDSKDRPAERNYTRGPWHVELMQWSQGADLAICCPHSGILAEVRHDPDIQTEDEPDGDTVVWQPYDKPNATLMAAAPELLETLEALQAWAKALNLADGPGTPLAAAAAAIDKARRVTV